MVTKVDNQASPSTQVSGSTFFPDIIVTAHPKKLELPSIKPYDVTLDPSEHSEKFYALLTSIEVSD